MKWARRAASPSWRRVICAVLVCEAAYAENAAAGSEIFHIDPALTRAEFKVGHFWVTTLHGTFGRAHGTIVLDTEGGAGNIDFTLDADSVDTGWSVRDDFIRGEHMFDASRFPK